MESKKVDFSNKFRSLPYAVVDLAISEGWVKELAYYLHITSTYGNGIVYDYSCRSLSEKTGYSKSTINKVVNFLLEIGLLKLEGRHLKGTKTDDLLDWYQSQTGKKSGKGKLKIKLHNDIKLTEWNLYARVPLNGIKRQKYVSAKRAEVNVIRASVNRGSYVSSSELKKLRCAIRTNLEIQKTEKAIKTSFTGDNLLYMSDKYLMERTGKSLGTIRSMVKFWIKEGIITTTFHKGSVIDTHFGHRAYEAIKFERPSEFSNTYLYKGRIISFNKRSISYGYNTGVYKQTYLLSNSNSI